MSTKPVAEQNIDFSQSIDTPEWRENMLELFSAIGSEHEDTLFKRIAATFDTRVEAAVEQATQYMVPLSADGKSVWIDGCGDVELDISGRVKALNQVQRYEESDGEGGGVWPKHDGPFVKLREVLTALSLEAK